MARVLAVNTRRFGQLTPWPAIGLTWAPTPIPGLQLANEYVVASLGTGMWAYGAGPGYSGAFGAGVGIDGKWALLQSMEGHSGWNLVAKVALDTQNQSGSTLMHFLSSISSSAVIACRRPSGFVVCVSNISWSRAKMSTRLN